MPSLVAPPRPRRSGVRRAATPLVLALLPVLAGVAEPRAATAVSSVAEAEPRSGAPAARETAAPDRVAQGTAAQDTPVRDTATHDTATRDTATRDTATRDTVAEAATSRGGDPERPHPEAREAISRLRSPYCPGLMLEICPSAEAALLRDSIQMLARGGMEADSLVEWMLANHGEEWRGMPRASGTGLWAWLTPPLFLLLGLGAVVVALRHLRARGGAGDGEAPEVSESDRARLDAALREMEEREGAGL